MRLIDADALKDDFCKPCDRSETGYTIEECREHGCGMMSVIDKQTTIEAEPVKHGRWIDSCGHPLAMQLALNSGKCSECGLYSGLWAINQPYKYCPFCGARMDGGADND